MTNFNFYHDFLRSLNRRIPYLPECLLFAKLHTAYLEGHIRKAEKQNKDDMFRKYNKYLIVTEIMAYEYEKYHAILNLILQKRYADVWRYYCLLQKLRCVIIKDYLKSARSYKMKYQKTGSEVCKDKHDGYKRAVKILIYMPKFIEKTIHNFIMFK